MKTNKLCLESNLKSLVFLSVVFSFTACDPGLSGDLIIYNESAQTLKARYVDYQQPDTIYKDIAPDSTEKIKVLSGLGSKKTFDCCPCELQTITIASPSGRIKKDPYNKENWIIPNKSKLKKFGWR